MLPVGILMKLRAGLKTLGSIRYKAQRCFCLLLMLQIGYDTTVSTNDSFSRAKAARNSNSPPIAM